MRHNQANACSGFADPVLGQVHRRERIGRAALGKTRRQHGPARKELRWDWSYEAVPAGEHCAGLKARGTLITDQDANGDGIYEVLGIEGRRDGVRITGLVPAGTAIPGNVDSVTGIAYNVDNKIQPASKDMPLGQLTSHGIGFSLADGSFSNLFLASYLSPPVEYDFHSVEPFPAGPVAPNTETIIRFQAHIVGVHF